MSASSRGLLPTKLHPRQTRPQIVARPRLVAAIERCAAGPLTLVCGPAGAGKSTAVIAWAEHSALPVAWLSLDPGDDAPMRFLAYLLAALHTVEPTIGADAADVLAAPPASDLELALAEALVIPLVDRRAPLALVLDDLHLIADPRILRALRWLLDNQPPCLRLLLLSRSEPALGLAQLRARGGLGEIGVEALRFSLDEAQGFYREIMGLDLPPERVAALEAVTEGWPAGAQLTALSLQTGGARDRAGGIDTLPRGDDRWIADYLMAEVLDNLAPPLREVLLATALPDRICAPLAAALVDEELGEGQGRAALAAVERANLFLLPLDRHGRWFRYHHLFADFLRRRAAARGEDWIRARHGRAARWFAARDLRQEAYEQALAAGDEALIGAYFEGWSAQILAWSQTGTVRAWLDRLPPGLRAERAAPWFMDGWCDVIVGQLRSGVAKLDRAEALARADDTPLVLGLIHGLGPLLRTAALLRAGRDAEADAISQAYRDRLPLDQGREPRLLHASHLLHQGLAALESGDPRRAAALLEQAEAAMRSDPELCVVVLAHLSEARRRLGALDEADRCARRAIACAETSDTAHLSPAGLARVAVGWVAFDRGDHERALAEASAGVERLELLQDMAYLVRGVELRARARAATGALAEALDELDDFLVILEGTDMRPAIDHMQALRAELAAVSTGADPGREQAAAGALVPGSTALEPLAAHEALTSREREVLILAAAGASNREIAKQLFVSVGTVKTHMHRILAKLDAPNRTRAVHRARRAGLL